ncbi:hypothetical protein ACTSKR_05820 [Chitinibacteraceae bacterium HSL-7]
MSPLWIEHIAWLAPETGLLASVARPGGQVLTTKSEAGERDAVILRLQQLLTDLPKGRFKQDRLELMLGSAFCRYAVLPWQDNLHKDEDWRGYAAVLMSQQFGVSVESWRIRVAPAGYGQPRLAAAVDEGFYQAAAELTRAAGIKLQGAGPTLVSAINQHCGKLKGKQFALLLLEAGVATVAFSYKGAWRGVLSQPLVADAIGASTVSSVVRDAAMLCNQPVPEQIYVVSSDFGVMADDIRDFTVQWLGGIHPQFSYGRGTA